MGEITVIGAGMAGCTIGHLLTERGFDVTILEKDHVGGLLREIELESGYHCDSAPHILFFDPETEGKVENLFSKFTGLESHDFYAKSYPTGDLSEPHDYPVTRANIQRWDDSEQIERELAAASGKTNADFFDRFMINQMGETLYKRYSETYTEKHWGVDPSRITGDWFDFKISFPDEEDTFFGGASYYPDKKYTTILNEMIEDVDVRFEGVTSLNTTDRRIESLETEAGNTVDGDIFVSTIDPSLLVDDIDATLNYRSMVIVGVHVSLSDRLFPSHASWGYFPNHYEFTRVTDYDFVDQGLPSDEYILTIEFPTFLNDDIWTHPDEWFEAYLNEFFDDQNIDANIIELQTRRAPRAYPLPVKEEIQKFEILNGRLSEYDNMHNLGRVSTYEYIWIKDIVTQAYEAADEIQRKVVA